MARRLVGRLSALSRGRAANRAVSSAFEQLEPRALLSAVATGSEFQVSTYTTSTQRISAVASDAAGDFVVAWASLGQDGSGYGVYAQRYNAGGVAQGAEFRVNTYTTNDQRDVAVAMDSDGDFVIAWSSLGQDGSIWGVYAQRYNAAGVAQGSEFQVNIFTTSSQLRPSVAMDSAGNFVIGWDGVAPADSGSAIYARRYNAAGVAQGSEFHVNTYTSDGQRGSDVAMDASGDFVVVWQSYNQDGSGYGVYAQRYNAAGVAQGAEFRVNTFTTDWQDEPDVAVEANGDFVVAWQSNTQDGSSEGIYARRYNAAGVALGGEFRVNTFTTAMQALPAVAMDADGDFVVTWFTDIQDGSSLGIYAQRYNAAGVAQGPEFRVNTYKTNSQHLPSVAIDDDGDFVVTWASKYQDGDGYGIYAQRLRPRPAGLGDFDDDGNVDSDDVDILWHIIRGTGTDPNANDSADLNLDGFANQRDVDVMLRWCIQLSVSDPGQPNAYGDSELDDDVDGIDFDAWRTRPGYAGPGTGKWASGDFDGDGDVDGNDFELWRTRPTEFPTDVGPHAPTQSQPVAIVLTGSSIAETPETAGQKADAPRLNTPTAHTPTTRPPDIESSPMYRAWHARRLRQPVLPKLADDLFSVWR